MEVRVINFIMKNRLFLLLSASTFVPVLPAQTVQWMHQGGINGVGRGIATDGNGQCYVAGQVGNPALFDLDTTASHFADIFVAKYDDAGNILWVRTAGNELVDQANAIVTDADGRSYVTGFFGTNGPFPTVAFDDTMLTGYGSHDLFLAKYAADGTLLWVRHGGGLLSDEGNGVALTADGNVVVSGSFQGTAMFGGNTLVSDGLSDMVLLAFDTAGNVLWSERYGGTGDDRATQVCAYPNGGVAVVGDLQNTVAFGGTTLNAAGLGDLFVARFDTNGQPLWAARAGSAITFAVDQALDIAMAPNGDVVFCGEIAGTADFDGITMVPNGSLDLFIARYDGAGNALWVHHAGGPQQDHAYGVALDNAGNSYLTGQVDDGATTVFDSITLPPFGNECVFLAKYDASGAIQYVKRYAPGLGRAVATRDDGCLYFTGGASGIVGQPSFDLIPWQYVDRAIFTARFCEAGILAVSEANDNRGGLALYPNPASDRATLHGVVPGSKLSITDGSGRVVLISAAQPSLDLSGLAQGMHVVTATAKDGSVQHARLLITR